MKTKILIILFVCVASVGAIKAGTIIDGLYYYDSVRVVFEPPSNFMTDTLAVVKHGPIESHSNDIVILDSVELDGSWRDVKLVNDFRGCSNLNSVTIGTRVIGVEPSSFFGCYNLKSIIIKSGNTHIDSRDNCNAIIYTASNILIVGCQNTVIPNSVIGIGYQAFANCKSLTSITIPSSIMRIEYNAFSNCNNLSSITIPNSVTHIGEYAFEECRGLISITCLAVEPPRMGINVFYNVNCSSIPLYVPEESIEEYRLADQWREFNPILPIEEGMTEINNPQQSPKQLRDNQIYILRGDKTYTLQGQEVK